MYGPTPVQSIVPGSTNNALANLQMKHGMVSNSKSLFISHNELHFSVELKIAGAQALTNNGNGRELHNNSELGLIASGQSPESANRAII